MRYSKSGPRSPPGEHGASGRPIGRTLTLRWHRFDSELVWIGAQEDGFACDDERPRHRVILGAFELASRPVTAGEYLEFIEDGGYTKPELWMSDDWAPVTAAGWQAPFYWHQVDGRWHHFTLGGLRPLQWGTPVCLLSYYEADAFARWAPPALKKKPPAINSQSKTVCAITSPSTPPPRGRRSAPSQAAT